MVSGRVAALSAALVLLTSAACGNTPPAPGSVAAPPASPDTTGANGLMGATPSTPAPIDLQRFADWKNAFRAKALAAGISPKTFDAALGDVTPNAKILEADQKQPESNRAIWDYIDTAVSAKRITNGTALLKEHAKILSHIQKLYGVSPRFVVAIWGLESNYGVNVGGYNIFESLATLAFDGRRQGWAESELLSALKIVERGDVKPEEMMGSWAGAMGQTQFVPSAYLTYAVDDDGDGRRDLFQSIPDVLASTANFLAKWNWRAGEGWGEEVKVPKGFDYSAADPTITLPMTRWRQLGIRTLKGAKVPGSERQGALFLPAGYRGPAFLLSDNFKSILHYNNSTAYGLAVGLLADRLKGAAPIAGEWPKSERPLTSDERREMQDLLNKLGFNVGDVDGVFGAQTRLAIKSYQKKIGEPADGFPTPELLDHMRTDAAPSAAGNPAASPPADTPASGSSGPAPSPPAATPSTPKGGNH